ncbi:hypothetical protein CYMTET_41894 [Cymbomonas tetramitiformis]|uniref:Uncharacterized protein n=1 Tax=Cymbomonas tetramitiformis TaxID=36881 RepID=A0AAE0F1J0_9CHLO|nr:hypothetical protein CYMTET_41894 [Cymbomonas tetramitiformis]|eukprot:gene14178-16764_t
MSGETSKLLDNSNKCTVLTGPACLTGVNALIPEFAVIGVCFAITVYVGLQEEIDYRFYIELFTLFLGVVGVLTEIIFNPKEYVGAARNYTDTGSYVAILVGMCVADYFVRDYWGGSKLRILSNWAVLVGSASSQNLTCPPGLSKEAIESGNSIFAFVAYEVFELWVSLFGTGDIVCGLLQFLFRRVVLWNMELIIGYWNYGWIGGTMFGPGGISMFQASLYSIFEPYGDKMEETDELEISVVGKFLLGLPVYSGVLTPVRYFDGTIFCEQIVSFSSPTSIVGPRIARGHCHYCHFIVSTVRSMFGKQQNPLFRKLDNRASFRVILREWLVGDRRAAVKHLAPDSLSDPLNSTLALLEQDSANATSATSPGDIPPLLVGDSEASVDSDGYATKLIDPIKIMRDQTLVYSK